VVVLAVAPVLVLARKIRLNSLPTVPSLAQLNICLSSFFSPFFTSGLEF